MNIFHVLSIFLRELTMLTFLIAICIFSAVHAANLETVHDEELLNLIKTEKYVIVLFSKFVFFFFGFSECFSDGEQENKAE